ncbi:restriction endonuclease, partial [bacterium]
MPEDLRKRLGAARVAVVNYHAFRPRSLVDGVASNTVDLLRPEPGVVVETERAMVDRLLRDLGTGPIIVLNDEAHHCYDVRIDPDGKKAERGLDADEKEDVKEDAKAARVWYNGLRSIGKYRTLRSVYDLSATPFFMRGSGYTADSLFPWIVSDFDLVEAIESGVVKIPRLPVQDDTLAQGNDDLPKFRRLYEHVRESLPKKGEERDGRHLDPTLQNALDRLYDHWRRAYTEAIETPGRARPVLIVVCNNTATSEMLYKRLSGENGMRDYGHLLNEEGTLRTILVDSKKLESGEPLPPEFKKSAARELAALKEVARRAGRKEPDDAELLREAMNTVGRPGGLGEGVRCVVSVGMLTEGWDANNVTHILGLRKFGTRLLAEQVMGRGLRRMTYTP